MVWGRGVLGAGAALVLVGCPTEKRIVDERDPWEGAVSFEDPDGAFEIEFPVAPESDDDLQGVGDFQLVVHSLTATLDSGDQYLLAWSDAPAGVPLAEVQVVREETPEENARRDGGDVVDAHEAELFGRTGLEFSVDGHGDTGFYYNVRALFGGRTYELTVIRGDDDRANFDRFVESFHLLQPPLGGDDADFFAAAEDLCAPFFGDRARPTAGEVATFYEDLVEQLVVAPASAEDQGDAAAFIDSIRRSIGPARAGEATHADTDLTVELAEEHGAPSCA